MKIYTDGSITQRTGIATNPRNVVNGSDVNELTEAGFYVAGFANGCANLPNNEYGLPSTYGFGMIVTKGGGLTQQLLLPRANGASYMSTKPSYRVYEDYVASWTAWQTL